VEESSRTYWTRMRTFHVVTVWAMLLVAIGLPVVTIGQAPSLVNLATAGPHQSKLPSDLTTDSASGVGGLWRDPYGKSVAADSPVGWWRLNYLDYVASHAGDGGIESPCISCSGDWNTATHPLPCAVEQEWCVARIHANAEAIAGIPNSESLHRSSASPYHPASPLASHFAPALGEGIASASHGASGEGNGLRLHALGGLTIAHSPILHAATFTFEFWLRLRGYYVASPTSGICVYICICMYVYQMNMRIYI